LRLNRAGPDLIAAQAARRRLPQSRHGGNRQHRREGKWKARHAEATRGIAMSSRRRHTPMR
jgi:hypothetical protein